MTPVSPYFAERAEDLLSLEQIAKISGLDFICGIAEGRYPAPPIARTLSYRMVEVEEGRVVFRGQPDFTHYNPIGTVHGGWFGTLLDSCMACAVQTCLPAGTSYTTLEYKLNILRPAFESTGPLDAIGEAIHVGRRTATAEGRLVDTGGKIYATGTTTCLVMKLGQSAPSV
ncbi:MAG: PaaI family thioesterase [Pseudomonadota bacterium]